MSIQRTFRRVIAAPTRGTLRKAARSESLRPKLRSAAAAMQRISNRAAQEIDTAIEQAASRSHTSSGDQGGMSGEGRSTFGAGPGDDGLYGAAYFGAGRNPQSREGLSGYESYDRVTSNANLQAYTTWRCFDPSNSLDIGCALGWSVEAFCELGFDAQGVEYSEYAVAHCAPGARGHIHQGDLLKGLKFSDGQFDLVTAFEILEHLPPESIPVALAEIRRVTKSFLFATIPTFGPNEFGPDGWFYGKVRDERLAHYESMRSSFEGPVPFKDLMCDRDGNPVEGHLCIASFSWWQKQFEAAGFERSGVMESRLYPIVAALGLTGYWNLHVLRVPGTELPSEDLRSADEIADIEQKWEIDKRIEIVRENQ
ncbi:MAG TPA: class I SAM-dependent methyltransferase [Acidimicrobiales bacterium]|nr:class I SAM-dependent methyltransferase [Acidimicrobiales bacterium]